MHRSVKKPVVTMKTLQFKSPLMMLLLLLGMLSCPAWVQAQHALTIYVDGSSFPNGHVFLSLSDSANEKFYGFHSVDKKLALARMGGGEVRDDRGEKWDIRKEYPLTPKQFQQAMGAIGKWKNEDQAWWVNHHCGDFVETVAKSAGASINLPWTATGKNRPGLFASYLEKNGGERNVSASAKTVSSVQFTGTWRIAELKKAKRIEIRSGAGGYTITGPTFPFVLQLQGGALKATHVLSLAELEKGAGRTIPARYQPALRNKVRVHLTITLNSDGKTARYVFDGCNWDVDLKTKTVSIVPRPAVQTLTLIRE